MIEILLRFSLFGLSLAGYAYLFVRVCHFPKHISWIAACCLPILVLSFVAYGPKGWLIWGHGFYLVLAYYYAFGVFGRSAIRCGGAYKSPSCCGFTAILLCSF